MDIVVWLRSLGLGKYEAAFGENEITEKVLPNLTAEDLKDLDVSIVGHRRTLLDAIAVFAPIRAARRLSLTLQLHPMPRRAGRRPRRTPPSDRDVLCLVGSTALSTRMDPEDLREVISAYQKAVAEAVQRFGGLVAKYMGDGVLIYFGYPHAHEDVLIQCLNATGLNKRLNYRADHRGKMYKRGPLGTGGHVRTLAGLANEGARPVSASAHRQGSRRWSFRRAPRRPPAGADPQQVRSVRRPP
jgi:hypothetical protein